jgi:hypothetical protein
MSADAQLDRRPSMIVLLMMSESALCGARKQNTKLGKTANKVTHQTEAQTPHNKSYELCNDHQYYNF